MIRQFVAVLLCLFAANRSTTVTAHSVMLAECPKEPDVVGEFTNNGRKCVRDRQSIPRTIVDATCPPDFHYKNGYCRKLLHKHVRPTCPAIDDNSPNNSPDVLGWQRFGGKCHSKCLYPYKSKYAECSLPQATLSPRFMTCPDGQHRYDAYCCTKGVDCPQLECKVGLGVPGTFHYTEDGICQRSAQSLARITSVKKRNEPCPEGQAAVSGVCQARCPAGFTARKGTCELRECSFDTVTDSLVTCWEGAYSVPSAIF